MYISSIGIYIHTHSPTFTATVGDIYIYMPHPTRCLEAVKDEGTIGRPGVRGDPGVRCRGARGWVPGGPGGRCRDARGV